MPRKELNRVYESEWRIRLRMIDSMIYDRVCLMVLVVELKVV